MLLSPAAGSVVAAGDGSDGPRPRQIEEIVVTAQKIEQGIGEVPIAVSAVGGDVMREAGISGLASLESYVPNVKMGATDAAAPQLYVRGFGTNTFNASFEPGVGLVVDEVYLGKGGYFTQAVFDVERVEVLRGPQGTLFGKNTVAGVFNVVTAKPTEELSGNLLVRVGEFGERQLEAGVGGPLTDWLGVRLSGLSLDYDGRLWNTKARRFDDFSEQRAGRLKLHVRPTDALGAEVGVLHSELDEGVFRYQLDRLDDGTRDYLDDFDPRVDDDPFNFRSSQNLAGTSPMGTDTQWLTATYDLGTWLGSDRLPFLETVLVVANSRQTLDGRLDLDSSPADLLNLSTSEPWEQQSLELRFAGSATPVFGFGAGLDFVVGAFLFRAKSDVAPDILLGSDFGSFVTTEDAQQLITGGPSGGAVGGPLGETLHEVVDAIAAAPLDGDLYRIRYLGKTRTGSLFGQATFHLTEEWNVTAGLRFNRERKNIVVSGESDCIGKDAGEPCILASAIGAKDYGPLRMVRQESDVSPKLALGYEYIEGIHLYASWARGFKGGGVTSSSFTGDSLEFKPEQANTYEVGLKSKLLQNSMTLNLSLFNTDFDNLQVTAFNGVAFEITNAAAAYSRGAEVDLFWLTPWEPLSVTGAFSYLHARYESFPGAPAPVAEGIGATQDLAGGTLAFVPEKTLTVTPRLEIPFLRRTLFAALDVIYSDGFFSDLDLDPATRVDASTILNARLGWGPPDGLWRIAVGAKNLTGLDVRQLSLDSLLFPGTFTTAQQPGRSLFASLTSSW